MKRVAVYLLLLGLTAGLSILIWQKRWDIHDWAVLRGYDAPSQIAQISSDTAFSEYGERLFYVSKPSLLGPEEFNEKCPDRESSIILGCYDGINIYVYDVNDPRVADVEEVTSAHEMLHAAYDRLNDEELAELREWLQIAWDNVDNQRVLDSIQSYVDGGIEDIYNEVHSIVGTEVRDIPDYLEDHYAQFFTDRTVVVAMSEGYESVFVEIEEASEKLRSQLSVLKIEIDTGQARLSARSVEINTNKVQLDSLLASGQIEQYNDLVPAYNDSIETYNRDVASMRARIKEYNELVFELNRLSVENNAIYTAIDSNPEEL
ncbi:MAG: hypothetical protein AAF413_02885 [Patescibacteria group bacterium]